MLTCPAESVATTPMNETKKNSELEKDHENFFIQESLANPHVFCDIRFV